MSEKLHAGSLLPKVACAFTSVCLLAVMLGLMACAETGTTAVCGQVYEFEGDSHYEISEAEESTSSDETDTYGEFFISANVTDISEQDGFPAYEIEEDGTLSLFYNYGDTLLTADETEWHLVEDNSKKIDGESLDAGKILYGAIIVEISTDQLNWTTVETITNAFEDTPIRTEAIYTAEDIQLLNGCYYRVTVVYKLSIQTSSSNLPLGIGNKTETAKYAEVYEFYACTEATENTSDNTDTFRLGSKVRTLNFKGYYGEQTIDSSDIHYGWTLGNFFVSGYTDTVIESDGNVVFLKNVGDEVTLWFNLQQDIDAIEGDSDLTITADTEGYDQYFETETMDFGRGTLIIRYTDYNNVTYDPVIYTNYLEANTTVGADTIVQLFEEGDYEVALDYEVTKAGLVSALDKTYHYRIFFTFSVRNGNCMVYPFDVETGEELTNSSITANGFRLDLANSRYLTVYVTKEVLKDSADGLVEDTRFNHIASDGSEYTDEGIYTITVENEYTGQTTTKKIYVGTNEILMAYVTTGLSIEEINALLDDGATIESDGTIVMPVVEIEEEETVEEEPEEPEEPEEEDTIEEESEPETDVSVADETEEEETGSSLQIYMIIIAAAAVIIVVLVLLLIFKTKREKGGRES